MVKSDAAMPCSSPMHLLAVVFLQKMIERKKLSVIRDALSQSHATGRAWHEVCKPHAKELMTDGAGILHEVATLGVRQSLPGWSWELKEDWDCCGWVVRQSRGHQLLKQGLTSYSSKGSGSPGILRSDRTTDLCVAPDGDSQAGAVQW